MWSCAWGGSWRWWTGRSSTGRGTGGQVGPVGAVPAVAPDWQQHAVSDSDGGGGHRESGLARVLGCSLRRLSADCEARYGHPLELARRSWIRRAPTATGGAPKEMFLRPLRPAGRVSRIRRIVRSVGLPRDSVGVHDRRVAFAAGSGRRVVADADPDAFEDALRQWAAPRGDIAGIRPTLGADSKRIPRANHHPVAAPADAPDRVPVRLPVPRIRATPASKSASRPVQSPSRPTPSSTRPHPLLMPVIGRNVK